MDRVCWNEPKFGEAEKKLVIEVLNSGYVSEGPKTKELEEKLSKVVGTKHIIMTTSCTAALYLAIEADKRIRKYTEGEVIIPDLTMVGTKNAVEMAGLRTSILEVLPLSYTLAPTGVFTKDDGIKFIILPVNLLGRSVSDNWTRYGDHIESHTIIYDNAGCLGSKVPNGKVGCYSLQGNKMISCGQGGFCATDDDEYAKVIRQIKDFGREDKYDNNTKGFNFKFNDILAAVALGQLKSLDHRKMLLKLQWEAYEQSLSRFGKFFKFEEGEIPLWVEFKCKDNSERNALFDYLEDNKIHSRKPWEAITGLSNAKDYTDTVLWLPNGAALDSEDLLKIINLIERFYKNG